MEGASAAAQPTPTAEEEHALLCGDARGIGRALVDDELGRAARCKVWGWGRYQRQDAVERGRNCPHPFWGGYARLTYQQSLKRDPDQPTPHLQTPPRPVPSGHRSRQVGAKKPRGAATTPRQQLGGLSLWRQGGSCCRRGRCCRHRRPARRQRRAGTFARRRTRHQCCTC